MSRRIQVPVGTKFGMLSVIEETEMHKQRNGKFRRQMVCECQCGQITIAMLCNLRSGHTTSCGCVQQSAGKRNRTHGRSGSKAYRAWADMIQRCYNPSRRRYETYGARGITVCQQWRDSFDSFLKDMGEPPSSSHSIDRKDNDGNYEPDNCHWATAQAQARNTSRNRLVTFRDETACIADWAERLDISYATLYYRITHGWNIEDTFTIRPGALK